MMGVATVSLQAVGKRLFGRSHRLHALVAKAREQSTPDSEIASGVLSVRVRQAQPKSGDDGLCAGPHRQLFEDCGYVMLDGSAGYVQTPRERAVGVSARKQLQHFNLPRCKSRQVGVRRGSRTARNAARPTCTKALTSDRRQRPCA